MDDVKLVLKNAIIANILKEKSFVTSHIMRILMRSLMCSYNVTIVVLIVQDLLKKNVYLAL